LIFHQIFAYFIYVCHIISSFIFHLLIRNENYRINAMPYKVAPQLWPLWLSLGEGEELFIPKSPLSRSCPRGLGGEGGVMALGGRVFDWRNNFMPPRVFL
jgi:hypothetical protein